MNDMPAIVEEARLPPGEQTKTWMFVYYTGAQQKDPQNFCSELEKSFYSEPKSLMKLNEDVKQMAAALTADANTSEVKVEKLFESCRTKITNTSNDATGITPDQRKELKDNKNPSDTLKRASGSSGDIDLLFASLATALGFDARIVLAPDRSDILF